MKLTLRFLFLALLFLSTTLTVCSQDLPEGDHSHDVFQKIDRAFEHGKLSIDERVLYKFYASKDPDKLPEEYRPPKKVLLKCGTPATSDFHRNKSRLSAASVSEIQSMMQSSSVQASETYTSASGKFLIHYETAGADAVPPADNNSNGISDYVEEVAAAADSSYNHEVLTLGYTDPIPAGESYDIEVLNLQSVYGLTYVTFDGTAIQIENDFTEGFPPNDDPEGDQIGAVKVTIAHEFKHAIQYIVNSWSGETGDWLEMDATLMEEVVYDNVNDYYNYLASEQSIFLSPRSSFYPGSYQHVSWALFFEQKYGSQFWVDVWETIDNNPFITMVDAMSLQLGGNAAFNEAFTESQLWHYASGSNATPGYGFEESINYPTPDVDIEEELFTESFSIPRPSPRPVVQGFTAHYYQIPTPHNISGDVILEITSSGENKSIGLIAYHQNGSAETSIIPLSTNESSFKMPNLDWDNVDNLGLVIANSSLTSSGGTESTIVAVGTDNYEDVTLNQNYPNPFNPQTKIRFTLSESSPVELTVYDTSGRLVRTLIDEELPAGLYEPVFDGSDLASGIYLYRLKTNQRTVVKKMTLIK